MTGNMPVKPRVNLLNCEIVISVIFRASIHGYKELIFVPTNAKYVYQKIYKKCYIFRGPCTKLTGLIYWVAKVKFF